MNKNYVGLEVPLARWTSIDGKVWSILLVTNTQSHMLIPHMVIKQFGVVPKIKNELDPCRFRNTNN
jgi:hypothetical protein